VGHVFTGDLGIIKDRALQKLISKGRQNSINWEFNYEICAEAVKEYKCKWC